MYTIVQLTEKLNISRSQITKYKRVLENMPEFKYLFDENHITPEESYSGSGLPPFLFDDEALEVMAKIQRAGGPAKFKRNVSQIDEAEDTALSTDNHKIDRSEQPDSNKSNEKDSNEFQKRYLDLMDQYFALQTRMNDEVQRKVEIEKAFYDSKIEKLTQDIEQKDRELDSKNAEIEEVKKQHEIDLADAEKATEAKLDELRDQNNKEIASLTEEHNAQITLIEERHSEELTQLTEEHRNELRQVNEELLDVRKKHDYCRGLLIDFRTQVESDLKSGSYAVVPINEPKFKNPLKRFFFNLLIRWSHKFKNVKYDNYMGNVIDAEAVVISPADNKLPEEDKR